MSDDGTIFPNFFNAALRGTVEINNSLIDTPLRVGEVTEIIYPSDKGSVSKNYVEYTVQVAKRDADSTSSTTPYHGCIVGQLFGGYADQFRYTLRQAEKKQGQEQKVVGIGSKVLLLCINGHKQNAVILCGLPDSNHTKDDKPKNSKDMGHNLEFRFNGIDITINKDGELNLTFNGATKNDNTLADSADSDAQGTMVSITKDGNLEIQTPKEDQFLRFNHKDKKIEMQAQKEWDVTIKGEVNITADKNVNIKSSGVIVGDATDQWPLFSTYRTSETGCNTVLSAQFNTLGGVATTAAAGITAATAGITTAAGVSVGPLAPLQPGLQAAAAGLTSASAAIASLTAAFAAMGAAIQKLEAQAPTYLSKKNKND